LRRTTSRRRIKMKLMKSSLIASTFLLVLIIAGCSATPAAGPQGPPGPQGPSGYDRDRDRDRDADHGRQDQGREDQSPSCPPGEHRDRDKGCVRD
jgi:Spy/CpxP family protein refolding chaperone